MKYHARKFGSSPPMATIARDGSQLLPARLERGRKGRGSWKKLRTFEGRVIPANAKPKEKWIPVKKEERGVDSLEGRRRGRIV